MTSLCIMKRGYNEIFSFPLACPIDTPFSESVLASSAALADLENVGVAFEMSLLSSVETEIYCVISFVLLVMSAIFDLLLTLGRVKRVRILI